MGIPTTALGWEIWNLEVDVRCWEARLRRGYWDVPAGRIPLTESQIAYGKDEIKRLNRRIEELSLSQIA